MPRAENVGVSGSVNVDVSYLMVEIKKSFM